MLEKYFFYILIRFGAICSLRASGFVANDAGDVENYIVHWINMDKPNPKREQSGSGTETEMLGIPT